MCMVFHLYVSDYEHSDCSCVYCGDALWGRIAQWLRRRTLGPCQAKGRGFDSHTAGVEVLGKLLTPRCLCGTEKEYCEWYKAVAFVCAWLNPPQGDEADLE